MDSCPSLSFANSLAADVPRMKYISRVHYTHIHMPSSPEICIINSFRLAIYICDRLVIFCRALNEKGNGRSIAHSVLHTLWVYMSRFNSKGPWETETELIWTIYIHSNFICEHLSRSEMLLLCPWSSAASRRFFISLGKWFTRRHSFSFCLFFALPM